ncbi:MAG: hypothetical protein AAGA40_18910 [Cyanobacteria bacterium P01_E01_bin.45]
MSDINRISNSQLSDLSDLFEDIPEQVQQSIVGGTTFFHFKDLQIFSGSDIGLDLKAADALSVYSLQYTEMTVATDVQGWVPSSGLYDVFGPRYARTSTPYLFFNREQV